MRRNLSTERYIRAATRGLRGQVRLDVQLELRHHLHERVGQLKAGNYSAREVRHQDVAAKDTDQTVPNIQTLLFQGGDVATNAAEGFSPCV